MGSIHDRFGHDRPDLGREYVLPSPFTVVPRVLAHAERRGAGRDGGRSPPRAVLMATITVGGYFGFGNTGDELLLLAFLHDLRQHEPESRVFVLSETPAKTSRDYGVSAVNRWNPIEILFAMVKSKRFVLAGGGLLQETTGPWNHFYYLGLVLIAKLVGCRTEMRAMGIDPIRTPINRFWTRWVIRLACDRLTVRDEASRQVVSKFGLRSEIVVVRDPVSSLPVTRPDASAKRLAVSLAAVRPGDLPEWASFVTALSQQRRCPVDLLVFYPLQDLTFAERLKALCPEVDQIRVPAHPRDVLEWMGDYRFVASSRFHALVLAQAARIPFLGLGNEPKVIAFCQRYGQPHASHPLNAQALVSGNKSDILGPQSD